MYEPPRFDDREHLFSNLIVRLGLKKVEERYEPENFGNFFVTLSAQEFWLRYINDRGILDVKISSKNEPDKWYHLSFIKNFVEGKKKINTNDRLDNASKIEMLNEFLIKDFHIISSLFNQKNYENTKQQLSELLKEEFKRKFSGN